jgi:cytoskeleton protein RodZ
MSEPAATLGPRLKAEREQRGLSAQKAADELHLDAWVIDALETDDYERIGPSVYAKGHLKKYAALLGLPAEDILAGYESRARAPKLQPSQPASVRLRTDTPAVSNLPWTQIGGSIAVVLLVLGVLWWKPWHPRSMTPVSRAPSPPTASAASSDKAIGADARAPASMAPMMPPSSASPPSVTSTPAPTPVTGAAAMRTAAQAPAASAAVSPAVDTTAGVGRARLRLSFSADSWVDIHDAAGRRAFAGKGRANSVRTVAGIAPMRVYLGFASGVQLEINNRTVAIGPQFVAGDVARFEAGADGVLRRDTHSVQTHSARPPG